MSEPRKRRLRGLDRLFRTSRIIIPIGVLGNITFSLLTTERSLLAAVGSFPRLYLALAIALALVPWLTNSLRLLIWGRFLGLPLKFRDAFQMTLAVDLGSAIAPTAVGGNFFKWGMLVQRGMTAGGAASLTTFPMLEDGLFFLVALPITLLVTASWKLPVFQNLADRVEGNAVQVLLVAAAIGVLTWLAVRMVLVGGLGGRNRTHSVKLLARIRRKTRATWRDARAVYGIIIRNGKSRFALSFTLTAIQWGARYSVISALAAFLGAPVQPVLFWTLQWVVFTLMTMIPTPGAAGGAEAAFYIIYSPFLPRGVIGLATAGWRFLTFYLQLGLASIIFFFLPLPPPTQAGAPQDR
ncbi:MAG: flippase-like domain-containing protein [Gemmatimonadetes bacterium]|nr:flippase-like domain-containing protein [Gemmatimonadota bacterium]